jgi:hypothetical protein
MPSAISLRRAGALAAIFVALAAASALAQENYETWPLFKSEFPSTGGGGIMIKGYDPVVVGDKCKTDFSAVEPNGTTYYNSVEFDAVPTQGGILCTNGKWRSKDGTATGTTSFRVFIKNGIRRSSQ